MNEIQYAVVSGGLDVYRSPSIAKGMPIGLSLFGSAPCSHRNGIISSGILRFSSRKSGGKAHRKFAWWSFTDQADDDGTASFQLANLRVGLQPKRHVPSLEKPRSPRELLAVTTPCPRCNASLSAIVDKLRTLLLPAAFYFSPNHHRRLAHGSGPAPVLFVAMSTELAMDLRSQNLLDQEQFGFRSHSL